MVDIETITIFFIIKIILKILYKANIHSKKSKDFINECNLNLSEKIKNL